jgi:hypothetical protein
MAIVPLPALIVAVLAIATVSGHAGPCGQEIDRMQARVDAALAKRAATGPAAPESAGALLHRQPTPDSLAKAEARVGDLSPEAADAIVQGMARARAADAAADAGACERALAEVRRAIGR